MSCVLAPVPDFRYVGLEPTPLRPLGLASAAAVVGAGGALALSGADPLALGLFTGLATLAGAIALTARRRRFSSIDSGVSMGIVPWGVLVHTEKAPRILRWAAVRRLDVVTSYGRGPLGRVLSSRVVVETDRDCFVGTTFDAPELDGLARHLEDYAAEQALPIALDLEGDRAADLLEPSAEPLLGAVRAWLETAAAATRLDLAPAGYRRIGSKQASARAIDVLRQILADRTPKAADPRAFAAVVAAELGATELTPDLAALTQCPHPFVAAVAKQAAHRVGVTRARVGTLEEVAPFLFDYDRALLEAWGGPNASSPVPALTSAR